MTTTTYTNGTTPHANGTPSKIDTLIGAINGKKAAALQDWALQQAPLLAGLSLLELERFNLALVGAGVTKSFVEKSLKPVIRAADSDDKAGGVTWEKINTAVDGFGYAVRMNELDDTVEVNGERMSDGIEAEILMKMYDAGFRKAEWVRRAITATAYQNRYHPIRDFLSGLVWDKTDWIAELDRYVVDKHPHIIYADGSTRPVFGAWLRRWGIGAVAKIMKCGKLRGQNPVLVWTGEQNAGKSTLARFLNPLSNEFHIESGINPDSNDHDRYLATKFIWEVGELGATTRRADQEALKEFLTRQDVTFRVPYAHHPVTKPAAASFIGTINPVTGFLSDPTGHRRFLPVDLAAINFDYQTAINCHQLWAQFVALYNGGESAALTPEERVVADRIRLSHETEDNYAGFILKYYNVDAGRVADKEWAVTTADIVLTLTKNGVRGANVSNIGNALKRLGLDRRRERTPEGQVTLWYGLKFKTDQESMSAEEIENMEALAARARERRAGGA